MNPEVKQKWVDALNSGIYLQGEGALKSGDGKCHCCMGVLCELYRQEVGGKWSGEKWENQAFTDADGNREHQYLTEGVAKWAGLDKCNPYIFDPGTANEGQHLSEWNDESKYDFQQIGRLIGNNL